VGAGGIERRDESELGVASERLGSTDYRAAGSGKAALERIICDGVEAVSSPRCRQCRRGRRHPRQWQLRRRTSVAAKKCRVDKARSGGIQLGHKCGRVRGVAACEIRAPVLLDMGSRLSGTLRWLPGNWASLSDRSRRHCHWSPPRWRRCSHSRCRPNRWNKPANCHRD
jgi:hypothetical protein